MNLKFQKAKQLYNTLVPSYSINFALLGSKPDDYPSIHSFSSTYWRPGHKGSSLSNDSQTFLSPATFFSSFREISKGFEEASEIDA